MVLCVACELKLKPNSDMERQVEILRYDRIESRYLTTGDFSALQEMNTEYPIETRTLVENVLKLGAVYEPDINSRFLNFYQDTTLQTLITDAETQYASIDDINKKLSAAFGKAEKELSHFKIPKVYAQIGALDQSIIVGDKTIGICLDKYLGEDYPLYAKYYSKNQCKTMSREYIVPDCLSFYLLSIYQMPNFDHRSQQEKDLHMGKVMYAVNKIMGYKVFTTKFIDAVESYMHDNKNVTLDKLLISDNYKCFSQYL
ncbi:MULTISPECIES: gliding motility protein GldB-related protein [Prevotella]|uniref:Gliding motility protein GldB n=1 Tax=Prevotella herbatica TaxID=2801997 RepID=A0ABN6EKU4_9BACT|nr:gliding motility protein GldB [Prevotella sp.]BCS86551.1 hypothetical protein prwr041_24440 [Prevotella herbatica]